MTHIIQTKVTYLMDALRVNSERWAYIETQVMENLDIDLDMVSAVRPRCARPYATIINLYRRIWCRSPCRT